MPEKYIPNTVISWWQMDTKFNLELDLVIQPRWWRTKPVISYGIDELTVNTIQVTNTCNLRLAYPLSPGEHSVWIEFKTKTTTTVSCPIWIWPLKFNL